jgi:kinesin family protein 6/9
VVDGFNGTVLCYGQTGAGKTYTMTGSATVFKYRGILPRAINQVYALCSAKFDQAITIRVSYCEIYNERIRDLLPDAKANQGSMQSDQNLQITDDSRGGVLIKGLQQYVCDSEEDALNCLFEGELNRTFRQHYLNATSSRAHCIFTVNIESRSRVESSDKVVHSKLHLVDLAGSERTKKTHSEGLVLKEASFINKSLTFLEQVVLALCDRKRDHIPYRQSKLTNLLRDSLGGNCKTVMVANIWPEAAHFEETTSTLKFATRMMKIQNEASINTVSDPNLQIRRYEHEIKQLKQELAMHDTLANRGRITYSSYSQEETAAI